MGRTICIAGKNKIAVDALKYVATVYPRSDIVVLPAAVDSGEDFWQPSLRRAASQMKIHSISVSEAQKIEGLLFISLEFDKIIKTKLFCASADLYNIHFSLLPRFRGMFTSCWPILLGETSTGCSLHQIDDGIDTGPVIDQASFSVEESDTAKLLYEKYCRIAYSLLLANFSAIYSGNVKKTAQSPNGATYFSRKSINYENLSINLNVTSFQLQRQINAFHHRSYQLPLVCGEKISHCVREKTISSAKPGSIIRKSKEELVVSTADFDCRLIIDKFDEMMQGIRAKDDATVEKIICYNNNLLEESDRFGQTPLLLACRSGSVSLVALLLRFGAAPHRENPCGQSAYKEALKICKQKGGRKLLATIELYADGTPKSPFQVDFYDKGEDA